MVPDGWPSHAIFYLLGVAALTRRPGEGRDCDVGLWGRVGGSRWRESPGVWCGRGRRSTCDKLPTSPALTLAYLGTEYLEAVCYASV